VEHLARHLCKHLLCPTVRIDTNRACPIIELEPVVSTGRTTQAEGYRPGLVGPGLVSGPKRPAGLRPSGDRLY